MMLIYAQPRAVSPYLGTFVHQVEERSLHQRLVSMSNNNLEAWGVFGPVASPTSSFDNWDDMNVLGVENRCTVRVKRVLV